MIMFLVSAGDNIKSFLLPDAFYKLCHPIICIAHYTHSLVSLVPFNKIYYIVCKPVNVRFTATREFNIQYLQKVLRGTLSQNYIEFI